MSKGKRTLGPYIINNQTHNLRRVDQQKTTPSISRRMPNAITRRTLTRDPFFSPSTISASGGYEPRPPTY